MNEMGIEAGSAPARWNRRGTGSRRPWRRSVRCWRGRRARSSCTARAARWGAAIAAATSDATLLYVVPDEETAETRVSDLEFFLPAAHAGRRSARAAGGARAAGPRRLALRRDAARSAHDAAPDGGAVPAVAGVRAARAGGVGRGAVPAGDPARAVRFAVRGDRDRARRWIGTRPSPRCCARASRARRWSRTRGRSRCAARSSICSRPSTGTRSASSCSATRSSRSGSTTRRRSGRCARWTRSTCTRCARPSRRRAPIRATRILAAADAAVYPSSKTRRLLEQVEEGEQFFGIEALAPAFHARMVPLFDYLPETTVCVVEEPEAVLDEARRQATRLREAAASRHVEHRLALPAEDFVLGEDEAAAALAARRRLELRARRGRPRQPGARRAAAHPGRIGAAHDAARGAAPGALRRRRQRRASSTSARRCAIACAPGSTTASACRVVAPNRTHADRLVALLRALGLATDLAPPRAGHELFAAARRAAGGAERIAAARVRAARPIDWWSSPRRRSSARARCARRAPARRRRSAISARSPRATPSSTTSTASAATAGSRS